MTAYKEVIDKYSQIKVGRQVKERLFELDYSEEFVASVLSGLKDEEKMKKMADVFAMGITSEEDILNSLCYIRKGIDIPYKAKVALSGQ